MRAHRLFTIGIGGAHSSVGKTTLAAAVLRYLMTSQPAYPFRHRPRLGAVKYTKTALYASLIDDETVIRQTDKDTARLAEAGAEQVLWIKSRAADLKEVMPLALERLSGLDGVVIEGNSAIEFAKPDIVIFIAGESEESIKLSADKLLRQADIIIVSEVSGKVPVISGAMETGAKLYALKKFPYAFDDGAIQGIISLMEEIAKRKDIDRLLREKAIGGKLSCAEARKIAEELSVSYQEVGAASNELKIKIKNCELGCF